MKKPPEWRADGTCAGKSKTKSKTMDVDGIQFQMSTHKIPSIVIKYTSCVNNRKPRRMIKVSVTHCKWVWPIGRPTCVKCPFLSDLGIKAKTLVFRKDFLWIRLYKSYVSEEGEEASFPWLATCNVSDLFNQWIALDVALVVLYCLCAYVYV